MVRHLSDTNTLPQKRYGPFMDGLSAHTLNNQTLIVAHHQLLCYSDMNKLLI